MARRRTKKATATFTSDGQLLAELGERLVASPEVALAELVKNSYDADASTVNVWLDDESDTLCIEDDGHGMTEGAFRDHWMQIATSVKLKSETSPEYGRPLTGAKGVGRFAVRFLGRRLVLTTVAFDESAGEFRRLTAVFDWDAFEAGKALEAVEIPYSVDFDVSADDEGTLLEVSSLQDEWDEDRLDAVASEVYDIVTPPAFSWLKQKTASSDDPGFRVYFAEPGQEDRDRTVGSELLDRYVARVRLRVLKTKVVLDYDYADAQPRRYELPLKKSLVGRVKGEIRYYPKRGGVFRGMRTYDGRRATTWIREHSGVKVIDRGFRLPPYGELDNDWLNLSADKASRTREWGSSLTRELFPEEQQSKAGHTNPLLKVPANHQLIGAVAVESRRPRKGSSGDAKLLQPAMDRQGFVENDGYRQLKSIVRAAVEILAIIDVEETEKRKRKEARRETSRIRKNIRAAIARVSADDSIPHEARSRIVRNYEDFGKQVDRLEEAHEEARRAVETLSLLGILSGFMTHEASAMMRSVSEMLANLEAMPASKRPANYDELVQSTRSALAQLRSHIDYAKSFVSRVRDPRSARFKVSPQVALVKRQLEVFASDRGIAINNDVATSVMSPRVSVAVYSGILLNLLTNAIKAVLARGGGGQVAVEAEDADGEHVLRVLDTGVGLPEELRDQVFEPLFTTTQDSPLGTGMGLGLFIVRRTVKDLGGTVEVLDGGEEYETCFEVRLPNE